METGYSPCSPRSFILESLADIFPEFDPGWDTEVQEAWIDTYSRLLNIVDEDKEQEEQ